MLKYSFKNHYRVLACLTLSLGLSFPAHAEEAVIDIPPKIDVKSAESSDLRPDDTHGSITLTPDKSEILNFDTDVQSVIVGNPAHLNVVADSARRLVLVPRAPGATYFTVLSKNGDVLMQRHILVASPQQNYLRVKRTCSGEDCEKTSVFYCPDTCHEVILNDSDETSSQSAAPTDAVNDAANGGNATDATDE